MTDTNDTDNHIGQKEKVKFIHFPSAMVGLVDTGATISSLDAKHIHINRGLKKVSFLSPTLSHNVITLDYEDLTPVQTADNGVEYRPVIKMDINIKGKILRGVEFNLNDREGMDSVLIGQNIIKAGGFLVNIKMNEETEANNDIEEDDTIIDEDDESAPVYKLERYDESCGNDQKWVNIAKIIVPTEFDKNQLLEAFKYIHDRDIDTDYLAVNTIAHMYQNPDLIEIVSSDNKNNG